METQRIAIIGAGNMGGAIARGLAQGKLFLESNITVSNPSNEKLENLQKLYPKIQVTNDNRKAVKDADIIILAVKPWKVEEVLQSLHLTSTVLLISVAAGITCTELKSFVGSDIAVVRAIPNTAISELASLTLVTGSEVEQDKLDTVMRIFNEMGVSIFVEENLLPAATALTSCGIAYVFKYVQAAMLAGVELGIKPKIGMKMLAQTLKGAAQILLNNEDTHPAIEIEKVTTPGGITIKGVNSLEHSGFNSAVIKAIKDSAQ